MIFSAVRKGGKGDRWSVLDNENYVYPGDDITFDDTVTNIGNGMDPKSGVFTAPISGIYSFSFSAIQRFDPPEEFGLVQVLKDGQIEFYIEEYSQPVRFVIENFEGLNHSWMMSLLQNEKVHLKMDKSSDGQIEVYNAPKRKNFVWFNGQLLCASE